MLSSVPCFIISVPLCRSWFVDVLRCICVLQKCFCLGMRLVVVYVCFVFIHGILNYYLPGSRCLLHIFSGTSFITLHYRSFSIFLFFFPFSTSLWDDSFEREYNSPSDYWGSMLSYRGPSPFLYFYFCLPFLIFCFRFVAPCQAL